MKCVIIDDDEFFSEVLVKFIQKRGDIELVNKFSNPLDALTFLKKEDVDLIFLDIQMPEMTGLEFVKSLGEHLPQVILTTTHEKFAIEAFKYDISGYLLKPVSFKEFCDALNKVEEKFKKELDFNENYIFIRNGKTIDKIKKGELKLIECIGDYVTMYTADKKYVVHSTMKALEKRFSGSEFLRVHRSYIIHIDAIDDIEDNSISFGDKLVPIGKTYLSGVYKRLNIL